MTLLIKNGGYAFFIVSYVIMKKVPIIRNFKRPIYQTFKETNLIWKWFKTLKCNVRIPLIQKTLKIWWILLLVKGS